MTTPPGRVRRAGYDDVPTLMAIRSAVRENVLSDPAKVPNSAVREFIDRTGIWVWEEDGRVLGFSAVDTRDGSVWALFVDPAWEGRGIGRALLPPALDDLRRVGWREVRLTTQAGSRAERFYRRDGWISDGTATDGDVVFQKSL